jgi:hypothetical protein
MLILSLKCFKSDSVFGEAAIGRAGLVSSLTLKSVLFLHLERDCIFRRVLLHALRCSSRCIVLGVLLSYFLEDPLQAPIHLFVRELFRRKSDPIKRNLELYLFIVSF